MELFSIRIQRTFQLVSTTVDLVGGADAPVDSFVRFIRRSLPHRTGGAGFYGRNRCDTRRRCNTARFLHRRPADRHAAGRNRPRRRQGRRTAEG